MSKKAWSYSALTSFETCPLRHYLLRVAKVVKEEEGEALRWGNFVHNALEMRLKEDKPLPETLKAHEGICRHLQAASGELTAEREITLDANFQPTGWFDKNAWLRSKLDVQILNAPARRMLILDWKTGKRKPDADQLELFAGIALTVEPEIDTVDTGFVWLKDGSMDRETFTRDDLPKIWNNFLPRVERLQLAHDNNRWPAKPSGLCRKWCPVGKRNCEHCGS